MVSRVFMVRPAAFGPNTQTAESNAFQSADTPPSDLPQLARAEFDGLVDLLRDHGVTVEVFDEPEESANPDAVFPNNWVSFHPAVGRVILYPMLAPSRRDERRPDWVNDLTQSWSSTLITDLSSAEMQGKFLEGTGSLVLDHQNKTIYMARSARSDSELAMKVAEDLEYDLKVFDASDQKGTPIYHTNVVMGVGEKLAMGCWDSIANSDQRSDIIASLTKTDRPILHLSTDQMNQFAGNWIELEGNKGSLFAASRTAWESLDTQHKAIIQANYNTVIASIPNIERFGGGSVRCMICTVDLR